MEQNGFVATPGMEAPVAGTPVTETPVAEPPVATPPAETPIAGDNKKSGNGLKIVTTLAIILALGGAGFGVYEMMQSSGKDSQIKEKDEKISSLKAQIDALSTTTEKDDKPTTDTTDVVAKSGDGPYIENGYFYVPKWGVKYKLSDSLTNYGYAVDQKNQGDSYGDYVVGLTAIMKSDYIEQPQATYYNDIFSCSVVTVRTMEESKKGTWGNTTPTVQFNGQNFVVHDDWRTQNCGAYTNMDGVYHLIDTYAPTDTAAQQLKAILSNPEKI